MMVIRDVLEQFLEVNFQEFLSMFSIVRKMDFCLTMQILNKRHYFDDTTHIDGSFSSFVTRALCQLNGNSTVG